ncbi:MAG: alpha/beta hydrolase [Gammaproteobacteria bacterium]|nr:alpha/beta hydrolase [Gammaproteobacteria bacterium]
MKKLSNAEQKFKAYLEENHIKPFTAGTEEEVVREAALFQEWAGPMALSFEEVLVKARDGFPVRMRVFNRKNQGRTLFYLPGNGYCVAHSFDANTATASRIAKASGCRVVIIDFRLMPEYAWPTPIQDVKDVINTCIQDQILPGIDPKRIVLGGLSGGAHASLMLATDPQRGFEIEKLLLVGGPYDFTFAQRGVAEDEALDYICVRKTLTDLVQFWGLSGQDMKSPEFSPLFSPHLKNLPETWIIVGEFDGIRSDSEALYAKLKVLGVNVSKVVLPGQTHNNSIFHKTCGDENDAALVCAKLLQG